VLQALQAVKARCRLHRDALDSGDIALQPPRRSDEAAAGAHCRDEMRHPPVGLLDNLDGGVSKCAFQLAGLLYWSG